MDIKWIKHNESSSTLNYFILDENLRFVEGITLFLRSIYKRVETNRTKCVERIRQCSFEISGASPIVTYKFLLFYNR